MAAVLQALLSICALLIILLTSWFVAILLDYYGGNGRTIKPHHDSNSPPFPSDKMEKIFWFVQITDIHISKYRAPERAKDLKTFCSENIKIISPPLVLVTGDLTDAKDRTKIDSAQYIEEWDTYSRVLKETKVEERTKWLDIRGNHEPASLPSMIDSFSVPSVSSEKNYFRLYSSSGRDIARGSSSYQYRHKTPYGVYYFNAIDTNPSPGPRRPFNFFGHVDENSRKEHKTGAEPFSIDKGVVSFVRFRTLESLAEKSKDSNMTIWFGHHTFSTLTNPSVRNVLRHGTVYLCGHLHTLAEKVPRMHALHADGHLELELGDWLDTRNYRILAIDHDLFSFVDIRLNQWPVVLITNPKDAHYIMPGHEPLGRIKHSSHIRMLLFSPSAIKSVSVQIDEEQVQEKVSNVDGPLFICKWNPKNYADGIHTLIVKVEDEAGRVSTKSQKFSLDGTRPPLGLLPAVVLLTNWCTLGRVMFAFAFSFQILWLSSMRWYSDKLPARLLRGYVGRWSRRFIALAQKDSLFFPLFFFCIYVTLGPWFIGELIHDHMGAMFVYGLYIDGQWIPGSLTFYYGILQLILFNLPLTFYLAAVLDFDGPQPETNGYKSDNKAQTSTRDYWTARQKVWAHSSFTVMMLWQGSSANHVWCAYGTLAFLLSPVKLWSIPFALFLLRRASKLR